MVKSSVEGASVVGITVVSNTVVGANVVGLAVVTASVVGDIVLDTVALDISQLTPEKPVKQSCVTQAYAQVSEQHMMCHCSLSAVDRNAAKLCSTSTSSKQLL